MWIVLNRMLKTELLQSVLFAIVLVIAVESIEKDGLKTVLQGIKVKKLPFFFYLSFVLFGAVLGRSTHTDPLGSVLKNFWPLDWEVRENIVAFIPLTFLYLLAYDKKQPLRAAIGFSLLISVFIEGAQLIGCLGSFQFSDLLYNTVGGALGGGLYLAVRRGVNRIWNAKT